jgi:lysozyme
MAEEFISWLQNVVIWLAKADTATGGWSSKLIGLASIVTGGSIAKGAFGLLGKMLGGGGGAAAAGGSSLLPYAGLLGVIGAGAAVTFNSKARDAWDKIAMPYADKALSALGLSADQQGKLGQKLIDFQNSFSKSGIAAGLTAMVAKFEGHVKGGYGTYRDIGGKLTAGFGHLVRPGEDFSHLDKAGALTLLAKDLQGAMASVAKLVKTHLTGNQASALDDFVFNVGEAKFAKSTLLRMLNSGDFAGAADQFQRWNQALVNGHYVVNQGLSDRRAAEAQLFRSGDKGVVISQKTDIHVDGNGDTARQVAREQGRVNGDLVRNFATATQ